MIARGWLLALIAVLATCARVAPARPPRGEPAIDATTPEAFAAELFAHFPRSLAFVRTQPRAFVVELVGAAPARPEAPRARAVRALIESLEDTTATDLPLDDADELLRACLALLADQTRTNSQKYVSHGTDHSVRVMASALQLYAELPSVRAGLASRYGLPAAKARLALMLAALLHDVGYADLAEHRVPKWLHALASAKLVRPLFRPGTPIAAALGEPAVLDLVRAIAEHNDDDAECQSPEGQGDASCAAALPQAARTDDPHSETTPLLHCTAPCTYRRVYVKADAARDPIAFVVRLADNLDATYDRLTAAQQQEPELRYLLRLYVDARLRAATVAHDAAAMARARARVAAEVPGLAASPELIASANAESFLHFYSNWIVRALDLDVRDGRLALKVAIRDDVAPSLAFVRHPGAGLYQVNRLASAAAALTMDGRPLLDTIEVQLGGEVPGLGSTERFPLRAFTKQSAFTPAGPSGALCGDACARAAALTDSPEPCLGARDERAACPAAFATIAPFIALTYPRP